MAPLTRLPDDGAPERIGTRYAHWTTSDDVLHGALEVVARDRVAHARVVDASAVHHSHLGIDDERVRGAYGAERLGQGAFLVLQIGEAELALAGAPPADSTAGRL